MSDWLLFDPMFRVAFFTGLALAVALSLTGAWLRLRGEWLAAFGLAQIAAAGGILALPLGVPVTLTATAAAAVAAALRELLPRPDNSHFALMILLGWSAALILAGNVHHGQVIGESLLRGQLYFSHPGHLAAAATLVIALCASLPWLQPRLLRERFFPDWFSANRIPAWPHRLLFSALVVFSAVLGTIAMGAFPAFALFFVPPWIAFSLVRGWNAALALSAGLGAVLYCAAFTLAMALDQPFGPTLVLLLVAASMLRLVPPRD